jgi:hypothetical protein
VPHDPHLYLFPKGISSPENIGELCVMNVVTKIICCRG